jgi:hypothetical protein
MAHLVYREHTIISSAAQDEITQQWLPFVSTSWKNKENRTEIHLTNSHALHANFKEAESFGLDGAKEWIDRKPSDCSSQ